ncbi:unnamed protein product [Cylindrotheca closterium]|uniref:Prolyl 4-hydroxylase alpha subunit domain-containing protein n=1 Tax=Cylindrotheca closterium TaxID=2856 RepID=A0AAD2G247_9STRA|nr:unnamed protein product [Cylindrotheca closterium]
MFSSLFQTQLGVQKVDYSTKYNLDDCLNSADDRANKVKFHKIGIPESIHADKSCFVINHVLSPNECTGTIARAENAGFRQALVNVGGGEMLMEDYRNSDRCIIDDHTFAKTVFERIKGMLPETIEGMDRCTWKLKGLNERMRILRYGEGNFFAEHRDGAYGRNRNEQSFLTIMIYLNDGNKDFVGGATNFIASPRGERIHRIISEVVPRTGMVLVFDHRLMHEGARLFSGKKYAIRTDVMYERTDEEGSTVLDMS